MPELPDVQVFKEYMDATCLHKRIHAVHLHDVDDLLKGTSASILRRNLKGGVLESTRRHGKHLFMEVGDRGWLVLHFGMTGFVEYFKVDPGRVLEHARLVLDFQGGHALAYVNIRKLGSLGWTRDVKAFVETAGLGTDALGISRDGLAEFLENRRGSLKGTLMNQKLMAGLGNVYADEVLFRTGVHPKKVAGGVEEEEVDELHRNLQFVLRKAIEGRVEEFPPDFLIPHREEGAKCPRCGGTIRKTRVSGRATFFCEDHQKGRS